MGELSEEDIKMRRHWWQAKIDAQNTNPLQEELDFWRSEIAICNAALAHLRAAQQGAEAPIGDGIAYAPPDPRRPNQCRPFDVQAAFRQIQNSAGQPERSHAIEQASGAMPASPHGSVFSGTQAVPAEPVAWLVTYKDGDEARRYVATHNTVGDWRDIDPNAISTPLYTHPATQPSGMVLVPKEPTGAMIEAGERCDEEWKRKPIGVFGGAPVGTIYRAMLSAAGADKEDTDERR